MNNSKIKPIIIVVTVFFTMLMMYSICGAIEGVTPSVETPSDNSVDAVTSATERAIKLQIGNPEMTVDGISREVDPGRGTVPIIKDDRTLLPVRAVIEAVGGTVNWDQTTGDISLSYGDDKIILRIDSTDAYLNGAAQQLDVAPVIIDDRTFMPIRFIAESFKFGVEWDQGEKIVSIYVPIPSDINNTADNGTNNMPSDKKILIAYFSRAGENYSVGVVKEGNTSKFAKEIAAQTGGDLFEIIPEDPYPELYDDSLIRATEERSSNARPGIKNQISNFDSYDTVFIGYPIWWGNLPMIMYTFMESYDFNGKTVIPFNTHEGSGQAGTQSELETLLSTSTVLEGLPMKGSVAQNLDDNGDNDTIRNWLEKIGVK